MWETDVGLNAGYGASSAAWTKNEISDPQISMLQEVSPLGETMPGAALSTDDLKKNRLYFEAQATNSDTCGMNALNNLCQRPQFKLADLQQAEAEHAKITEGGNFAHAKPTQDVPTGFFDVEAVKIAAQKSGLEIVDVEPVMDWRKGACLAFADSAGSSEDGSWFLGFLVYDRRPGYAMHYYTLRRDERYPGIWLRLDSKLPESGEECKNRRLTTDELWALYQANSHHFGAWQLRWYPVVYCKGAAEEVCRRLASSEKSDLGAYKVTEARAMRALKECNWVVINTLAHLLEELPRITVRELLVRFARPSEAEMRSALEDANWDLAAAQPAIDTVLRQRISLAQAVDAGGDAPTALSLCDWEPKQAAILLSLKLQCNLGAEKVGRELADLPLAQLREALQLTGDDIDRAEALISLVPDVGTMSQATKLLEQTKTWSVLAARRILEVQTRIPRVSIPVALEVLRRNDDDPHAACEMLKEYQKGVQRLVLENAYEDLFQDDEIAIAETALNFSDWDPNVAFTNAKNLTVAMEQTRKIIRNRSGSAQVKLYAVDAVLAALAASELKPQAAAALLLGIAEPDITGPSTQQRQQQRPPARPGGPAPQRQDKRGQQQHAETDEEYCNIM